MHRLLPLPSADDIDFDAAYWVPDPGRQHVRGAMVASADGAAQAGGRAGGLSGPADIRLFAMLRAQADVIIAGASTVRAEGYRGARPSDQQRAWRRSRGLAQVPPIAVVTRSCALDPTGPLFTDTLTRPLVITCASAPAVRVALLAARADVITIGERDVDLPAALDVLAERGLRRVSCEGGPTLLAQLAAAGRLDELSLTLSPLLLAGQALRITNGARLDPPAHLRLGHVVEEDGFLFLRYLTESPPPKPGPSSSRGRDRTGTVAPT